MVIFEHIKVFAVGIEWSICPNESFPNTNNGNW